MKREDLRTKLVAAGVADDKISELVDYVMAQNGADINGLKEELENSKKANTDQLTALQEETKTLKAQVAGYKDYEELKKFKEETIEKAENDKKISFLKSQGCKYPDLIMGKVDFSKATYDEESKTYKGLDDAIKGLKTSYVDAFEKTTNKIPVQSNPQGMGSDFYEQYKKEHPELKGL